MARCRLLRWAFILLQNFNNWVEVLNFFFTFFRPSFKGLALMSWYKKSALMLYISFSTIWKKIFIDIGTVKLRDQDCNSLNRHTRTKWIVHFVQNLILNNFCSIILYKIFEVFEIIEIKDLRFLATEIPNYITFNLNDDMIRSRLFWWAFPFYYKTLIIQEASFEYFVTFWALKSKGPAPWFDIRRKIALNWTTFGLYCF